MRYLSSFFLPSPQHSSPIFVQQTLSLTGIFPKKETPFSEHFHAIFSQENPIASCFWGAWLLTSCSNISSLGISDEPLFCCFVFHQFCIEDSPKLAANYPENIYVHNLLEICIRLSLAETPQNVLKKVCQHKWQSMFRYLLGMLRTINSHLKCLYFHFLRNSSKKGENIAMRLLNMLNAPGIATAILVRRIRLSL